MAKTVTSWHAQYDRAATATTSEKPDALFYYQTLCNCEELMVKCYHPERWYSWASPPSKNWL